MIVIDFFLGMVIGLALVPLIVHHVAKRREQEVAHLQELLSEAHNQLDEAETRNERLVNVINETLAAVEANQ